MNFTKKEILIILGLIIILFISVFVFTREGIWGFFNFGKPNEIGDTIGGITSPIINIFAAVLVYKSFTAQTTANENQFQILREEIANSNMDRNFDTLYSLINELRNDLEIFEYDSDGGLLVGAKAYRQHGDELWDFIKQDISRILTSRKTRDKLESYIVRKNKLIHRLLFISKKINDMKLAEDSRELLIELYTQLYDDEMRESDKKITSGLAIKNPRITKNIENLYNIKDYKHLLDRLDDAIERDKNQIQKT